eukprot:2860836-Amphidinium_carterae.1
MQSVGDRPHKRRKASASRAEADGAAHGSTWALDDHDDAYEQESDEEESEEEEMDIAEDLLQ